MVGSYRRRSRFLWRLCSQVQCLRCRDEEDTSQGVWLHPNADGHQPSGVHHRTELWYFTTFLIQNNWLTWNSALRVNITWREFDTHPNMCRPSFGKMHASDFLLSVVLGLKVWGWQAINSCLKICVFSGITSGRVHLAVWLMDKQHLLLSTG